MSVELFYRRERASWELYVDDQPRAFLSEDDMRIIAEKYNRICLEADVACELYMRGIESNEDKVKEVTDLVEKHSDFNHSFNAAMECALYEYDERLKEKDQGR